MGRPQEWKYVCFTSFEDRAPERSEEVSYLIFQRERGDETCREHWQGYAETSGRGQAISWWQKRLGIGKSHIEKRRGTAAEAADYCRKETSRLWGPYESGSISRADAGGVKRKGDRDEAYTRARVDATDWKDYIRIIGELEPEHCARSFTSLKSYAQHLFPEEAFPPYVAPTWCNKGWRLPEELEKWKKEEVGKKDRPKCLVLVGPSRLGKTQWARSLGRHMYWRGTTNVTNWDVEAKFLIFDDIEWKFIPQKKALLTCMGDATVTDKYKGKKDIKVDKNAIVLCNEFDLEGIEESEYWRANCSIVRISEPLFDNSQLRII